ncbi:hypothetical protein AB0F93_00465 [Micromonospora tulbaghiae]|uniref:hypothetical protein n=1 Tax=Micromonospora tulbaghiae TaxID=479978 RepID=UPI0033179D16
MSIFKKSPEFSTEPHTVTVTLTGPLPDDVVRVRRVGPYNDELTAVEAARLFERLATDRGMPGVLVAVEPFQSPWIHLDACPSKDFEELALLDSAEFVRYRYERFPDLHDRLTAAHGHGKAEWAWQQALSLMACNGDRKQPSVEDAAADPFREKVKAASARLIEAFPPPVLNDAARLLQDLVTVAERHGVDADGAAGHLAPFALTQVADRYADATSREPVTV